MKLGFPILAVAVSVSALAGCDGVSRQRTQTEGPLRVADVAMEAGAPELALRLADMELQQKPGNLAALRVRADASYALSALPDAEAAYREILRADPNDVAARTGLGRTLLRSDPAAAEVAFLGVLHIQPENQAALNDLGIARDLQGHHAAAQDAYRQALAAAPNNTDVKTNLDMSLRMARDGYNPIPVRQSMTVQPPVAIEPREAVQPPLPITFANEKTPDEQRHAPTLAVRTAAAPPVIIRPDPVPLQPPPAARTAVAHIDRLEDAPDLLDQIPPRGERSHTASFGPGPLIAELTQQALRSLDADWSDAANAENQEVATEPAGQIRLLDQIAPRAVVSPAVPPGPDLMITALTEQLPPWPMVLPFGWRHAQVQGMQAAGEPATAPADATTGTVVADGGIRSAPAGSTQTVASATANAPSATAGVPPENASAPPAAVGGAAPATIEGYSVQVGAFDSPATAQAEWQRFRVRLPELFANLAPMVQQADVNNRTFWRLRTGVFTTYGDAAAFCARLRLVGANCWTPAIRG